MIKNCSIKGQSCSDGAGVPSKVVGMAISIINMRISS